MLREILPIFALGPKLKLAGEAFLLYSSPKFMCLVIHFHKFFWFWCKTGIVAEKVYAAICPVLKITSLKDFHFPLFSNQTQILGSSFDLFWQVFILFINIIWQEKDPNYPCNKQLYLFSLIHDICSICRAIIPIVLIQRCQEISCTYTVEFFSVTIVFATFLTLFWHKNLSFDISDKKTLIQ